MPRFSLFTPLGHLRFSRLPAMGQRLFESGAASLGDGRPGTYAIARGGRTFAWLYAWSMVLATIELFQRRAGEQWDPERATDLLEVQERERGSIPRAGWTIGQRRARLARMRRLIQDVSRNGVATALAELLGESFLAFVPTAKADAVSYPASLGDSPQLLATPGAISRRVASLGTSIANVGSPVTVTYGERAGGVAWELRAGDVVVIEPENPDRAERVTLAAAFDSDGGAPYYLTFTPTKPHAAVVSILRASWPFWVGTKRHSLVFLTAAAAGDPEARRLVQWLMERYMRATSTWDIVGANDDGVTAGPFKVGVGKLGITPLGYFVL